MAEKKNPETAEAPLTMEAVKAEIAAMLAAAQQEADRIIAEAREQSGTKTIDKERAAQIEADKARGEELVEVKLFKDTGKYKDDVFVGCNGETIAIKRGEKVKIKRKFAEILENSQHQDFEAAQLAERKSKEWQMSSKQI